jgi:sugar O-acyltransferase (sialic acid O-acetyltransferase NeuD family)
MKDLIIVGAGGFGREVAWLIDDINMHNPSYNVCGFVDDVIADDVGGVPVLGTVQWLKDTSHSYHVVVAIGSSKRRQEVVETLGQGVKFETLIHPSAIISSEKFGTRIGQGCIVCAGVIVTVGVCIGNHVIMNLCCTVGHDVTVHDFVTLLPAVNVSGCVSLDTAADVGTGTKIIPGITIGANTIVGAGAVVVRDLPPDCTALGVPAKAIKNNSV